MIEPTDQALRRWLLHTLAPVEAEALEQRLLTDEDFGARLRDAETDLLDDYACGDLDVADRAAAAERFSATARDRMRLRVAVALARITRSRGRLHATLPRRRVASSATPGATLRSGRRTRMRRVAAAGLLASACALVLAVIGLNQRMTTSFAPPKATGEATITLLADSQRGSQRGANVQRIALPSAAATVRLQVEVDANDPQARYALSIDDAGQTVFSADGIGVHQAGPYRFVEVVLDARKLRAGSHRVRVAAEGSAEAASSWTLETRSE